jgi:acetolactate synthase I/II/III large subunit
MNGGEALVATLLEHGATTGFGVPGESYLALLEAMRKSGNRFRYVNTRHESGATFAAEAYGKMTGRPGIAFVTRGPGACNGSIGLHTAAEDSTPLVVFIGQVPLSELGLEAFQEVDYRQMLGGIAKEVLEPLTPAHVARDTARALRIAASGRAGPVAVVLPEEVTMGEAGDIGLPRAVPPAPRAADTDAIARARDLLARAERPFVIAGERVGLEGCSEALGAFAEASGAAVVGGFRRQDVLHNDHEAYIGHFGLGKPAYLRKAAEEADLMILAGCRPDAATSSEFAYPPPDKPVVHIYPDAGLIHRMRAPEVALEGDLGPTLAALARDLPPPSAARLSWRAGHREGYRAWRGTPGQKAAGDVDMAEVALAMAEMLPPDTVVTNDAGNFSTWIHRHYRFRAPRTQLGPANGAMGYAVPAAIGAALARPGTRAVAVVGDGGFMMTGMELATAAQEGLDVTVIVVDNGRYGTIWMHQHGEFGRESRYGVDIRRADLAAVAKGLGAAAWTVTETAAFRDALEAALARPGPSLIHLLTDPRDLSASSTIDHD